MSRSTSTERLIGIVSAAARLGCDDQVVRKQVMNGRLKGAVKKSGHWFVPESQLKRVVIPPVKGDLPPLEKREGLTDTEMVSLHEQGYTYAAIGASVGVTRQWVFAMVQRKRNGR